MPISFRPVPPHTIGLLGGVASGKSTVAAIFETHGLTRLDADAIARDIVADSAILEAIVARFGSGVLDPGGGTLDRTALATIVFSDEAALRDLEAITHPAIHSRIEDELGRALSQGESVVLDIPLLLENGWAERCDTCVFVEAPESLRRARAEQRGWPPHELARRESHQADLDAKRAQSGYKVRNNGSLRQTRQDVAAVIASLRGTSSDL